MDKHTKTGKATQTVATLLKREGIAIERIAQPTQEDAFIYLKDGRRVQVTLYQPFVVWDGVVVVATPDSTAQLLKAVQ